VKKCFSSADIAIICLGPVYIGRSLSHHVGKVKLTSKESIQPFGEFQWRGKGVIKFRATGSGIFGGHEISYYQYQESSSWMLANREIGRSSFKWKYMPHWACSRIDIMTTTGKKGVALLSQRITSVADNAYGKIILNQIQIDCLVYNGAHNEGSELFTDEAAHIIGELDGDEQLFVVALAAWLATLTPYYVGE
jgi:hypothetical protein